MSVFVCVSICVCACVCVQLGMLCDADTAISLLNRVHFRLSEASDEVLGAMCMCVCRVRVYDFESK